MSEDPSKLEVKYSTEVPEGCPPINVIHINMTNTFGANIEMRMPPDEAMLLANNLIGACLDCLFEDKDFTRKYIDGRHALALERKQK